MKITWLGHSCFMLEQDGCQIVVDPYWGVPGYPPLHVRAHELYCSHEHADHNYRDGVTLLPTTGECPFSVREVQTFHDDHEGALRGNNVVRCFTAGGFTVCHLGDLGHALSPSQIKAIGKVDVLLIPVGGYYTIGPREASLVIRQISPRCAVPMHYRHGESGLEEVGRLEEFLALFKPQVVEWLEGNSLEVTRRLPAIAVLQYQSPEG